MNTRTAVALTVAAPILGVSLALGFAVSPVTSAHSGDTVQAVEEDSDAWDCTRDGNRVCGPGNANHVPAGCYDDGGVMVAPWPCDLATGPFAYDSGVYVGGFN